MENIPSHSLFLGVGILLTCAVISGMVYVNTVGSDLNSEYANQIGKIKNSISERELTKYDGETVSGSDVINCIKHLGSDINIEVDKCTTVNGDLKKMFYFSSVDGEPADADKDPGIEYYDGSLFTNYPTVEKDGNTISNPCYINPNATFVGSVDRNENNVVDSISFEQTAYVVDAIPAGNAKDPVNDGENANTDLVASISELKTAVKTLQESISNMNTGDNNNNNNNNNPGTQSITIDDVQGLQAVLTGINTNISNLSSRISALEESGISENPGNNEPSIPDVPSDDNPTDDSPDDDSSVSELEERVSQLEQTLYGLSDDEDEDAENPPGLVDVIQGENGVLTQLEGIQSTLSTLQQNFNKHTQQNTTDLGKLNTSITNLETSITKINQVLQENNLVAAPTGGGS